MPFSEGPRNCVGQSLAKMEVLVVLAKVLAAFRCVRAARPAGSECTAAWGWVLRTYINAAHHRRLPTRCYRRM
jgi:cytochrome P450